MELENKGFQWTIMNMLKELKVNVKTIREKIEFQQQNGNHVEKLREILEVQSALAVKPLGTLQSWLDTKE